MNTGNDPLRRALLGFDTAFGTGATLFAKAPGRVNLIGEHTDYNEGFVLPCAIDAHIAFAARPNDSGEIRALACDQGDMIDRFDVAENLPLSDRAPWSNYIRGVVVEALGEGWTVGGMDVAIAGNIPPGSGLSSSAALEVGFAALLARAGGVDASAVQVAQLAQRAESDFVGMKCGIMDQLASAAGREGRALLIDCRSLEVRAVAVPDGIGILIAHSGVKHTHVGGEYNSRRRECETAAAALGLSALRDATLEQLGAAAVELDPNMFRRARHVISENERTLHAAQALETGDLETLGQLMAQSQASMRDDFEITTPEIDRLVDICAGAIGVKGGARMTGGGFGGCVVAVLEARRIDELASRIRADYFKGENGLILSGRPARGVEVIASG